MGMSYQYDRTKKATSPEQWELAGDILDKGTAHPAFAVLAKAWDKVVQGLGTAKARSDRMRRMGVGRTEDPSLIGVEVLPALEKYRDELDKVIRQLHQRLDI